MKTYAYRGFTADGSISRGLVEAISPKAARDQLARDGILAERLSTGRGERRGGMRAGVRGMFYRELASLLKSGMPLVSALGMLMRTPELEKTAGLLAAVRDHVREGSSLAAALKMGLNGVSAFEAATIDVAERTATLEHVLEQLALFIETRQQMSERLQHALIYPALVLGLGVTVAAVMLGVLVPRTQQMIGNVANLPGLTKGMLAIAEFFFPWGVGAILLLAGGAVFGWRHAVGDDNRRIALDAFFYRLPIAGTGYRYLVSTRFACTLGILMRAGVSLVEGVSLAGRATGSAWCERLAVRASEAIRHGQTLEAAIRQMPPLEDSLPGWIAVGEAGGDLAGMLEHAAERCDRRFDHFLSKTLTLMEPLLLLLVGAFVLLVTLAVILPIFTLTDAVLR